MKHLLLIWVFLFCYSMNWSQSYQDDLARYQLLVKQIDRLDGTQNSCDLKLNMQTEVIQLAASIYGKNQVEFALANLFLAKSYFSCVSLDEAHLFIDKTTRKYRRSNLSKAPVVPLLLSYKGYLLMKKGGYKEALVLGKQAVEIAETHFNQVPQIRSRCLNNLARILDKEGRPEEALAVLIQSKELFQYPIEDDLQRLFYHQLLPTLGNTYFNLGQYEKALPTYLEALEGCRNMPTDNPVGQRLFQIGKLYRAMGQYAKARKSLEQSAIIIKRNEGEYSGWYGLVMHALGKVYHKTGDYTKALESFQIAHRNYKLDYSPGHPFCAIFLSEIGDTYRLMGRFEEAHANLEKGRQIAEKSLGPNHPEYAARLYDFAVLYRSMDQHTEALNYINKALAIAQAAYSASHPKIGKYYNEWAINLEQQGLVAQAQDAFLVANDNALNRVLWQFTAFSSAEQEAMLQTLNHFFAQYQSFVLRHPNNPTLTEAAYNGILANKGRILGNRKTLIDYFQRQTGPLLFQKYEEWQRLQSIIARQSCLPLTDRIPSFDSIQTRYNALESELARVSIPFRENHGTVNWKMVQQALKPGETAIEFTHFDYYHSGMARPTNEVYYVAYLIQKEQSAPIIVPLFEENEVGQLGAIRKLYSVGKNGKHSNLNELIWQKLEPYLHNVNAIYFAPSGVLHRINFGAIPINEKETISDRFAIHQLLSTRQVFTLNTGKTSSRQQAMLYGGINYNSNSLLASIQNGNPDWPFLEWTEKEVHDLSNILSPAFSKTKVFTKGEANEALFKSIGSEQNAPYLLHLATHGYFFSLKEKNEALTQEVNLPFLTSTDPMIRSGLILAHANHVWHGGSVAEGQEDGVLTAYEVAQMNLNNTELVVLSACDTGLGDIKGNEGVYGLQRAFKLAGAKYLLMSLWNVNDVQSYQFMTTFYREWINGEPGYP